MRILARHYATGERVEIHCQGGRIQSLSPPSSKAADVTASWVAPSLFDLQINGCEGIGFHSAQLAVNQVRKVVDTCRRHGLGGFCPTVVTNSFSAQVHVLRTLRQARETDGVVAAAMPVFHLEGPYLSGEDGPRGAHPQQHIRPPDWEEFCRLQEAAGGLIRLVTLAPEHEGALRFIERLVASGVIVALGHTAAQPARIREAVAAGARLSTHLGNGCHALLPRHDNYLWEQLATDDLWASMIADGHHLPAAVVRCLVRVKTPARLILTCDAGFLAGLPPGRYRDWDQEFDVHASGRIILADSGLLAGSGSFTETCIENVIRFAGVSLEEAVDMAGARPRQLLGLPSLRLLEGDAADLVLFDWDPGKPFRVTGTVVAGQLVLPGTVGCLNHRDGD